MKIIEISTNGGNVLSWCLDNQAELKDNLPLVSIINDETCFFVKVDGVDFYQLFRLTQLYRNRLKVCNINRAAIPTAEELSGYFPGNEAKVENLLNMYTGLVAQMIADNDIVPPSIPKLLLPMITTTFTVQIPFSFVDAIEVMTDKEVTELFGSNYASFSKLLHDLPEQGATHSLVRSILIMIERSTGNVKYNGKYEKLLQMTKYFVLTSDPKSIQPFRAGLLSFSKYDAINRMPVQCSLFKPSTEQVKATMARMKNIVYDPVEFSFAIQLPIYHMQLLESQYFQEDLNITHRSSVDSILDNGIELNELLTGENEEAINNYRVRLAEAQFATLKLISEISNSPADFHPGAMFALLPPLYRANAVITFKSDIMPMLLACDDLVLREMFGKIYRLIEGVKADLNR